MKKEKNSLSEIQKIELEILKVIKKFCEEKEVFFFLCGGTLLGAIRHKGFIPWDDDIDIALMRPEYNKLYNILKKDRYLDKEKRYKALLPFDEGHIYPYIKIVDTYTVAYERKINKKYATGLWVDVFPYDYEPDTEKEQRKIYRKHDLYKKFFQVGISGELNLKEKILKGIAYIPYKIFTRGDYTYWVKKMMQTPELNPTNCIGGFTWKKNEKEFFDAEWYESFVNVEFEGLTLKAPKDYDKWLTHYYGDYMKLPKEEDRIIHGFKWHYIEKDKK